MPLFYIRQGLRAGEEIRLQTTRIIIGRSPHSTLVLPDENIDLAHASLEDRGDRWILQDLGAPGGTWLNDKVVSKPCSVSDGDVIKLGDIRIEIHEVGSPVDEFPQEVSAISLIRPGSIRQSTARQRSVLLALGTLAVGLLLLILWLDRGSLIGAQENKPPHLDVLLREREIVVAPGEPFSFISEVQDQEDLARIEFWVNDVLQEVNRPAQTQPGKMEIIHHWATDQSGYYTLSVIAYDEAGQPSQMVKIGVTVQEP